LNRGWRFNLADIDIQEADIDPIAESMLPHSTEIELLSAGTFIDTVYDPERASLSTLELLHANIAAADFGE
jgi:hypothetical protein